MTRLQDRLARTAAQYLQPGEIIQVSFFALGGNRKYNDRAVIVTDKRIMLCRIDGIGNVIKHMLDAPRNTKLGKAKRFFMYRVVLAGTEIFISYRFFRDADKADSLMPKS
jgi:hypothetical protein